jgi:hypothetical protein
LADAGCGVVSIVDAFIRRVSARPPDFQIGGSENPYCNRWWVIPRNRWFNIYLHQFIRDDDDRALHCHPWPNLSILLRGSYYETVFVSAPRPGAPLPPTIQKSRRQWRPVFRRGSTAHRIVLHRLADAPVSCWSLFLTGPVIRQWGFWCPLGRWVHWRDFTNPTDSSLIGKGCGE